MRRALPTLIALLSLTTPAAAASVPVTACGQTVPAGATGILQADLDCSPGVALALGSRAKLRLDGHTIAVSGAGGVIDVHSPGRHSIRGPGQIVNAVVSCGSGFVYRRDLTMRSVALTPTTGYGSIDCLDEEVENRLNLRDVHVDGPSPLGILGWKVRVADVSIGGSQSYALLGAYVKGKVLAIVGTGGRAIWWTDGYPKSVKLRDADIRDNAGAGVSGLSVVLRNSTVTGNGFADQVPSGFDYDVGSGSPPVLRGTSCDRSRVIGQSSNWGVCALD